MAGIVKILIVYIIISLLLTTLQCSAQDSIDKNPWGPLMARLIEDGEDEGYLQDLFLRKEIYFDPGIMARKLSHQESKLNYSLFLGDKNISKANDFLYNNKEILNSLEKRFGVDKEIMVGILLVETKLGKYLGSSLAFNILANLAATDQLDKVDHLLPLKTMTEEEKEKIKKKINTKSQWAYEELKALIVYSRKNQLDPLSLKSSIFGAIGICQFMPSNALIFGVDHNNDGMVNLFVMEDAIASMANYLKNYGWREGLSQKEKKEVLLKYNYSRPYVNTILEIAKRLENNEKNYSKKGNNNTD